MGLMEPSNRNDLWAAVHAERARLAEDLAGLDETQWAAPSLCGRWTVEDVVAHLTDAGLIRCVPVDGQRRSPPVSS